MNKEILYVVDAVSNEKNVSKELIFQAVETALAMATRKRYGMGMDARVTVNRQTGDYETYRRWKVMDDEDPEFESPERQILQSYAIARGLDIAIGDYVEESIASVDFGRIAAQTAKQVILQRLREAEREVVLAEFEDKIGTVVTGVVQRVEPRVVRVELGKAVGIMPQSEQIQGEYYGVGRRIKVFIKDIEREGRGPQLILSRGNEEFVRYLFGQEVPEMETGAVEIKGIAREAGRRTKLAVASVLPGIDPVGTFVGGRGTRVQAVMNEIGDQEKIDIIPYEEDTAGFIANAMSPAEVLSVTVDEDNKRATVYVAEDQQSVAIGRAGQNVRLASRLTGYELDIETKAPTVAQAEKKPRKNIEDSLMSAVEEAAE